MKRNRLVLTLMAVLCVAFAVVIVGCAEEEVPVDEEIMEPDPAEEMIEEVPEGVEGAYDEEDQDPGMEDLPPPTEEQVEQEPPIGDTDDDTVDDEPPADDM
ncbi:MAG: hypothetical protein ACOCZ7_02750 [Armatimonadota bacterium]